MPEPITGADADPAEALDALLRETELVLGLVADPELATDDAIGGFATFTFGSHLQVRYQTLIEVWEIVAGAVRPGARIEFDGLFRNERRRATLPVDTPLEIKVQRVRQLEQVESMLKQREPDDLIAEALRFVRSRLDSWVGEARDQFRLPPDLMINLTMDREGNESVVWHKTSCRSAEDISPLAARTRFVRSGDVFRRSTLSDVASVLRCPFCKPTVPVEAEQAGR